MKARKIKRVRAAPVYQRFGAAVAKYRGKRELTQKQLGALVNKPRASIASIEAGYQRVYLEHVFEFAVALGVEPLTLFQASRKENTT